MAEGFNLTTYYAKRIIGDTAAANAEKALLQTGDDITTDTWILHRTNRTDKLYGIKYKYDSNGHDKMEYYGQTSNDNATAWIQFDTGDASFNNILGKIYVTATSLPASNNIIYYLTYADNATSGHQDIKNSNRLYIYEDTTSTYFNVGSSSTSGGITVHNANGKYSDIVSSAFSANRIITLPDQTGTIALLTKTDINALINLLDTGSSVLTAEDYIITQYVGGGTTTTTYHRRAAKNVRVGGLTTARSLWGNSFDGTADISGNIYVSKAGETYVRATNTTTSCSIELNSYTDKQGLWSNGYWNGSTYTAASKWLIYRGTDGNVIVNGDITGNAASATYLKNQGRATDANITHITDGGMRLYLSSSSMTSNSPGSDGYILHYHWDTSSAWDAQLHIPDSSGQSMHYRSSSSAGTWGAWKTIIDTSNWYKLIFANKNISRSTLTVYDSVWAVTSGTDVFGLSFKDTGLTYTPSGGSATASSDTGDWRAWLTCDAAANNVKLNMRIDGSFQSDVLYTSYIDAYGAAQPTAGKLAGLTGAHSRLYGNALYITNPTTTNDQGWIRVLGTGETDTVLEIATGDDGGVGEQIVCRQYNTSNAVARELKLLDTSGNSTFPGDITIAHAVGDATLTATSTNPRLIFSENGTQPVHIAYSDWDSYRAPAGLKVVGGTGASKAWFEIEGNVYFGGDGIYHVGTAATQRIIRIIDSGDQYGTGVSIGAGGLALFGGGESTSTLISSLSLTAGGTENTYISSDNSIEFYPGQNSYDASSHISMVNGSIWAGVAGNTTRENQVGVRSGAGAIYMYAQAATGGSRGIYLLAHGTGSAKGIVTVDTNNNITYAGGAISGQLTRAGVSSSWIKGRDAAILRMNSIDGYSPTISIKTTNGSWEIGSYNHANYTDDLVFSYATDADYNSNNNNTVQLKILENGRIDGIAAKIGCPRVTKSANEHPGKNITSMQEFSSTSANLPSSHFYYILEAQGDDPAYSVQLAMGETASAIYYRAIQNNTYNDWNRLVTNSGSWSISVTGSSGSCTGNAATATTASKLGTANVGHASRPIYLAAGVPTATTWYHSSCSISGGNKANYPWHRFAYCTTGTGQWTDKTVIVIIHSRYNGGPYGMVKLSMRTNATNAAKSTSAVWIYRSGFAVDDIKISAPTKTTGTDETISAYIKCDTYPRRIAYILEGSNLGWTLVSSNEPNDTTTSDKKGGTEINASVSGNNATDGATVSYANSAGSASSATSATYANYPTGFNSRGTSATWGNQTGTTVTVWGESDGGAVEFRKNNPSSGKISIKVDGRFYGNEGTYPAMLMRNENSYWGLCDPDAANNVWIRTTTLGIIPYQAGNAGSGHCGLGTSTWYFSYAYIDNIYGKLNGSCTGNAGTASALTNLTSNDQASSSATQRYVWFCYDNNSTGRPAYSSSFTYQSSTGTLTATKVKNAVWNDYAECRLAETTEPGYCVTETASGKMVKTTKRLQPGCKLTSDTYGTCMGETEEAKTPIAVAGRVLAYPYRNPIHYQLGAAVCSAPNGTVDIMSRDEIMMYPERIVGTVSEIPTYDTWHAGNGETEISVNGRIWIYVR